MSVPRDVVNRPDWIGCVTSDVGDSHELHRKTWCGKSAAGWTFQSVDHAALNGRTKGRLVACPDCVQEISVALVNGHEGI